MRLDITKQEHQIIIDALSMPAGVSKPFRKHAEALRERLMYQVGQQPILKPITRIRGHWPTNHVTPTPRANWAYKPTENRVAKPKSVSAPLNAEQILASL